MTALDVVVKLLIDPAARAAAEVGLAHSFGPGEDYDSRRTDPELERVVGAVAGIPVTAAADLAPVLAVLVEATRPGGAADPTLPGAELPWVTTIERLRGEPALALLVAKGWFRHLFDQSVESEHGIAAGASRRLSAYVAAALAVQLGRHVEAKRWMQVGASESAAADAGVEELRTILRAVKIVAGDDGR